MAWDADSHPNRAAANTAASKALHRFAGKTPSAKDHCARTDPALPPLRSTASLNPTTLGARLTRRVRVSLVLHAPRYYPSGSCAATLYSVGRLRSTERLHFTLRCNFEFGTARTSNQLTCTPPSDCKPELGRPLRLSASTDISCTFPGPHKMHDARSRSDDQRLGPCCPRV
jgi:hypothetical protein